MQKWKSPEAIQTLKFVSEIHEKKMRILVFFVAWHSKFYKVEIHWNL